MTSRHSVFLRGDLEVSDVIEAGYRPGALGRVAEMHAVYYAANWSFGAYFERKVATELAEYLGRYDPERDRFLCAVRDGRIIGSVTIDGSESASPPDTAHLRWFIMDDAARGSGLGGRLMQEAMGFALATGFAQVYLWTFAGLDAARRLYDRHGFELVEELEAEQWGTTVREQRFVWHRS
jgi:GNAT superfamily N-acetyltransferase